jgi:hypothetical protein
MTQPGGSDTRNTVRVKYWLAQVHRTSRELEHARRKLGDQCEAARRDGCTEAEIERAMKEGARSYDA